MTIRITDIDPEVASPETSLNEMRKAGAAAAGNSSTADRNTSVRKAVRARLRAVRKAIYDGRIVRGADAQAREWLADNSRLLVTVERSLRDFGELTRELPAFEVGGELAPRVCSVAAKYLHASGGVVREELLVAFVSGYQEKEDLLMSELWALKPALQLAALERLGNAGNVPDLLKSIRRISEANWKELFESLSAVDALLCSDRAYARMEPDSRDRYRSIVAELASHSGETERQVAAAALALASEAQFAPIGGPPGERRSHVGYYLLDDGVRRLRDHIGYVTPARTRFGELLLRNATAIHLGGIEVLTLLIVYGALTRLDHLTPVFAGFFLLIIPATQAAVDFMNNLATSLARPRVLPKLDFSEGIPADCATMVAVPTLLLNETQVRELVMDLEIRYLANRDPNLYLALITDSPDSDRASDEKDRFVDLCSELIQDLNRRYGNSSATPFYMFHRHRVFNASEGRWMGWERKRGKLLDLNRLLRGGFDSFPVKIGNLEILPRIRYVITLDSDTQLPRGAAQRMIGAIAHPLNRAVIDPETKMVVEGYGLLQPRIGVSIQSASRSWLASLYSGQTGFDIYTRAVSDVYQDLFGEGIFTGKGIYEVDAFRDSVEQRFPENALLSHDLIEGIFARVALVSDIELIDDYPSHFSAYSRRKHRWMRGDWQILRWILARVPDREGRLINNHTSLISRWKIVDNLRRTLLEPATLALLLSGWFYLPGSPWFWTAVSVAIMLMPAYSSLLFAVVRVPWRRSGFGAWLWDEAKAVVRDHVFVLLRITFLLHESLLATDAIVRSIARVFFTRQRLLQWETAAEAEANTRARSASDRYLRWSPWLAIFIGAALWRLRPDSFPLAIPFLSAWILAGAISYWLSLAPRHARSGLTAKDIRFLRNSTLRIWRYFREFSSPETNWLIPDNVREDGRVADRLSPTNLGFLLNARVAAVQFGYLTVAEFVELTKLSLDSALRLPRYRGHFLNWNTTQPLAALDPKFVSTVDSGNLAACLWTLGQAAEQFAREAPPADLLWQGIRDFAIQVGSSGEPGAAAIRDRVLRSGANWQQCLPELEELALHFAQMASPSLSWWAHELVERCRRARNWLETGLTEQLKQDLNSIAQTSSQLVGEMDFSFLYDPRRKVLSVGYNSTTDRIEPSTYDLLASESRIASFVAIAKGDIPQESWFHLGRKHTVSHGNRVLISWTGTIFEYLMPALWMRHYPQTIMQDSMRSTVRAQKYFGREAGLPWGISESAHVTPETDEYGYAAFGLPELAMRRTEAPPKVISPYSTFLAAMVDAKGAMANLHRMDQAGFSGEYGFYEAIDYTSGSPVVVRSWMVHHLGMSMLAMANVLLDCPFQRLFHSEPYVLATELLLHERVPSAITVEVEEVPKVMAMADEATA